MGLPKRLAIALTPEGWGVGVVVLLVLLAAAGMGFKVGPN